MTVLIQVWHDKKIVDEREYDPEINQMETIEFFAELLDGLEGPGDGFTLMADKIS